MPAPFKRGDQDWLNFVNTALHEAMTGVEFDSYAKSFKTGSARTCRRRRSAFPSNSSNGTGAGAVILLLSLPGSPHGLHAEFRRGLAQLRPTARGLALSLGLAVVAILIGAVIGLVVAFALTAECLAAGWPRPM